MFSVVRPAAQGGSASSSSSYIKKKTVQTEQSLDSSPGNSKSAQISPATLKASLPSPLKASLPAPLSVSLTLGPGTSSAPMPLHPTPGAATLQGHKCTGVYAYAYKSTVYWISCCESVKNSFTVFSFSLQLRVQNPTKRLRKVSGKMRRMKRRK